MPEHYPLHTTHYILHPTYYTLHTTRFILHTIHCTQLTTLCTSTPLNSLPRVVCSVWGVTAGGNLLFATPGSPPFFFSFITI